MDDATYNTIATMAGGYDAQNIEYWNTPTQSWISKKPETDTIRVPGVVHECSTAFVGTKEDGGSLDDLYRPHGVKNVVSS